MTSITTTEKKIRALMPPKYGNILADRCNCERTHVYRVVNNEVTTADIWPQVLALAEEYQRHLQKEQKRLQKLKALVA